MIQMMKTFFGSLIKKVKNRLSGDQITQFLTENEAFATEKFDGTSVHKDSETDSLYARRTMIEEGAPVCVKESLEKVRQADVVEFRVEVLKSANIDVTTVNRLMIGELMCNKYYHYAKKGLLESWQVLGALLEYKSEERSLLDKLIQPEYGARIGVDEREENMTKNIQVLMSSKFVETTMRDFEGYDQELRKMLLTYLMFLSGQKKRQQELMMMFLMREEEMQHWLIMLFITLLMFIKCKEEIRHERCDEEMQLELIKTFLTGDEEMQQQLMRMFLTDEGERQVQLRKMFLTDEEERQLQLGKMFVTDKGERQSQFWKIFLTYEGELQLWRMFLIDEGERQLQLGNMFLTDEGERQSQLWKPFLTDEGKRQLQLGKMFLTYKGERQLELEKRPQDMSIRFLNQGILTGQTEQILKPRFDEVKSQQIESLSQQTEFKSGSGDYYFLEFPWFILILCIKAWKLFNLKFKQLKGAISPIAVLLFLSIIPRKITAIHIPAEFLLDKTHPAYKEEVPFPPRMSDRTTQVNLDIEITVNGEICPNDCSGEISISAIDPSFVENNFTLLVPQNGTVRHWIRICMFENASRITDDAFVVDALSTIGITQNIKIDTFPDRGDCSDRKENSTDPPKSTSPYLYLFICSCFGIVIFPSALFAALKYRNPSTRPRRLSLTDRHELGEIIAPPMRSDGQDQEEEDQDGNGAAESQGDRQN